jgi:hypothetical protein
MSFQPQIHSSRSLTLKPEKPGWRLGYAGLEKEVGAAVSIELSAGEVNEEVGEESGPGGSFGRVNLPAHALAVASMSIVELLSGDVNAEGRSAPCAIRGIRSRLAPLRRQAPQQESRPEQEQEMEGDERRVIQLRPQFFFGNGMSGVQDRGSQDQDGPRNSTHDSAPPQ